MPGVIETVAAFHAQTRLIGRAVTAFHEENLVVFDVIGELAADAAIGAQRVHRLVGHGQSNFAGRHQRAGRARLHTLAATYASGCPHRIVHVENDLGVLAAGGEADDIVYLLIPARPHAAGALDTGVEVDCDRGVRKICSDRRSGGEARLAHFQLYRPIVDLVMTGVLFFRHVGLQQLDDHLLRLADPVAVGRDLHALGRHSTAGRRQHPLAFDLDHTGAAISDRLHAGLVAQPGNLDAFPIRDLDEGSPGAAVTSRPSSRNVTAGATSGSGSMRGMAFIAAPQLNSCGKYLITQSTGFGAPVPGRRSRRHASLATGRRAAPCPTCRR